MNNKAIRLAQRREHLVAQAAVQRSALVQDLESWRTPLALTDQGLTALRYIRNHPKWLVGGLAVLAMLQPRNRGKWLGRAWVSWQVLHSLRSRSEISAMSPQLTSRIGDIAQLRAPRPLKIS